MEWDEEFNMARRNRRDVLAEGEIQVVHCMTFGSATPV